MYAAEGRHPSPTGTPDHGPLQTNERFEQSAHDKKVVPLLIVRFGRRPLRASVL